MNDQVKLVPRTLTLWVGILAALCYLAGLVCMFVGQMGLGMLMWVISTVGGGGFLYYVRQKERRAKEAAENYPPKPEG